MNEKKPTSESRVRDHLANERTYLAWVRTCIGIMAFSFVVGKFALFLKQITLFFASQHSYSLPDPSYTTTLSPIFGELLVGFGALLCLLAFIQYKKVEKQINESSYQPSMLLNVMLLLSVLSIGLFLAIYLGNATRS